MKNWYDVCHGANMGFLDIVVIVKGITFGYSSLSALATNWKITQMFLENTFLVPYYTYIGHLISCSDVLENITIIQEEGLD